MTLSIPERAVLLAATTAPLHPTEGGWVRTDGPGWLPRISVRHTNVERLLTRGLLRRSLSGAAVLTAAGQAAAETLRDALDPERRQVLRALDGAGELVRRERRISEVEAADVEADGGVPSKTVVEWMRPISDGPWSHEREPAKVCSGTDLEYLRQLGLVVLLAGGTRAQLTGAGRWCAAEGPGGDSKPGADQGAPGGGPEPETASEGRCGPGKAVPR